MVPKRSPCSQIACAQPSRQRLHLRRPSVGGQVEVELVGGLAEQQVAHRAADEIELVTAGSKALSQRGELGEHGGEAFRDHRGATRPDTLTVVPNGAPRGIAIGDRLAPAGGDRGGWRRWFVGVDLNPAARRGGHLAMEKSAHQ